jgi:hypothetical protein
VSIDLGSYNTVAERIAEFRERHPEGCLRPVDPAKPFEVVEIGEQTFIAYSAAAYRTPDDPCPGIGLAWEPFPGPTRYTRDSELQNAETSAWGRAIVAALAADMGQGRCPVNIPDKLRAKLTVNRQLRASFSDDMRSELTVGDVSTLFAAYTTTVLELEEMARKAEKHERREDRFRTWWTDVKHELDQLKRASADDQP